jgi:Ca2+-binding RTX toxin-like protein
LSINGSSTTSAADYSIIGGSVTVSGSNLTVTIPDGVGNVDLSLSPNDDSLAETTETLQLNLATGNYLRGTNNSAAIAITDNDTATITLGVSSSSFSESGGASIIAYSSAVADKDIVVNLTFGGTAIRGTDFSTSANTLVIPAGSSTGVLAITGINDALSELTKTLSVDIASISSPVPTQQNGIQRVNLTLLDDDPVRTATAPPPINFSGTPGRTLNGSPRPDALTGTANNDILRGFAGNDRLQGLSGNDRLDGGAGNDRLEAGDGDDQLTGGDGNDSLLGGSGNDVLIGGVGADVLIGGLGSDLFVFNAVREAGDRITDFSNSADLIDLRRLFAAPAFSGANPVARFNQFVRLVQVGANTEVRIDADGRGAGTAFVTLVTLQNLSAGAIGPQNFVVV